MKKILLSLFAIALMVAVSCTKEDDIRPIFPEINDTVIPEPPQVDLTQLVGNWTPNSGAYFKVYLYSTEDGHLEDSLFADLDETGFNFFADGTVNTPYGIIANYTADEQHITINYMGVIERTFNLLKLDSSRLVMEHVDTSEYTSQSTTGDTLETFMGIEIEHWDLSRSN